MNFRTAVKILCFLVLTSCNLAKEDAQENRYPDTIIIGHRGSGTATSTDYQENSIASIQNAFEYLNGVQVDIQCSKDGTIWLYNPAGLPDNDLGLTCIPQSTDEQLRALSESHDTFRLTSLQEVLELMAQKPVILYLSLHVIGYFPNGCFEGNNATREYFDKMAESLDLLLETYPFRHRIIAETVYEYFLDLVIANEMGIDCYLLGYEDFRKQLEIAIERSYQGVSFNFRDKYVTREDVELARQNQIETMLWNLRNEEEVKAALDWKPRFIRTGNIKAVEKF